MKIAICDDDQAFSASLMTELQKYFSKKGYDDPSIFVFDSAEAMFQEHHQYDIVFLDVEMSGLSGIAAAEILKKKYKDILIFIVTSHNTSYLDDAMEEGVYRYMMKPLKPVQFQVNMNSAIRRISSFNKLLSIETDNDIITVNTDDIIMVYTERRRIYIKTTHGTYKVSKTLQYWIDNLPENSFALSFKGILIHLKYVKRVCEDKIELTLPGETAYLSARNRTSFKKKFMQYVSAIN